MVAVGDDNELKEDAADAKRVRQSHDWEASGDDRVWVPTFNTLTLPHFAEHADWMRRRAQEAASDLANLSSCIGTARAKLDPSDASSRAKLDQAETGLRAGLGKQLRHANRLRAYMGDTTPIHTEGTSVSDEAGESNVQQLRPRGIDASRLLSQQKAAQYLGMSERKLRYMRSDNDGPPYIPMGGRIFYRVDDLEAYVEQQRIDPLAG